MKTPHVIASRALQHYEDIDRSSCVAMPQDCSDLLHWRGDLIEDDENDIGALFTNKRTLYSIVIFESEMNKDSSFVQLFRSRLQGLVECFLPDSDVLIDLPIVCSGAPQSLIASMNNFRALIEERRLKNRQWQEINQLPFKPLRWRTPEESFKALLSEEWG